MERIKRSHEKCVRKGFAHKKPKVTARQSLDDSDETPQRRRSDSGRATKSNFAGEHPNMAAPNL